MPYYSARHGGYGRSYGGDYRGYRQTYDSYYTPRGYARDSDYYRGYTSYYTRDYTRGYGGYDDYTYTDRYYDEYDPRYYDYYTRRPRRRYRENCCVETPNHYYGKDVGDGVPNPNTCGCGCGGGCGPDKMAIRDSYDHFMKPSENRNPTLPNGCCCMPNDPDAPYLASYNYNCGVQCDHRGAAFVKPRNQGNVFW